MRLVVEIETQYITYWNEFCEFFPDAGKETGELLRLRLLGASPLVADLEETKICFSTLKPPNLTSRSDRDLRLWHLI